LYYAPNVIGVVKSRNLGWAGNVAYMVADERCVEDYGGGT